MVEPRYMRDPIQVKDPKMLLTKSTLQMNHKHQSLKGGYISDYYMNNDL